MLPALLFSLLATTTPIDDSAVIELVMVDRFADGSANADDVVPAHLRRFQGGDLKGLERRLPWLKDLGVSHVWLTPLHRQVPRLVGVGDAATAPYHGYWPEDFTAIDPHFGTLDDLHGLANAAATDGIGLIVDVVVNHTGYGARDPRHLVRGTCGDGDVQACLFGLPDLKTEDPRVRAAVVDDVVWWLGQAPFAGVRLDAFKHIDGDTARAITGAAHQARPGTLVIAERWGATIGDDAVIADVASGATDAAFDFALMGLARDFVTGRLRGLALGHHLEKRAVAAIGSPLMLTFLDNHDTETWTWAAGVDRAPLGAPLLLLTPGIPVLTWGVELARPGGPKDPENRTMMPWDVADAADDDSTHALHWWRRLVALRRSSPAAQHGTLSTTAASASATFPWIVFERRTDRERLVTAIAVGRPLVHCEPTRSDEIVVDEVRWPPGRAAVSHRAGATCLQVPADGAVVLRLQKRATIRP